MKRLRNPEKSMFLLPLVLLFLIAAVLVFSKTKPQDGGITPPSTPTPSPQTSPSAPPTPINTTGWKTYTNKKYKYSFRYPPTLDITAVNVPNSQVFQLQSVEKAIPSFFQITANIDEIPEYCTDIDSCFQKSIQESSRVNKEYSSISRDIGGIRSIGFYYFERAIQETHLIEVGGHIFRIGFNNDETVEANALIDTVLGTFKFTK